MANPRLANQMMIDNDSLDINFCETLLGFNCDLGVRKISLCLLDLRF